MFLFLVLGSLRTKSYKLQWSFCYLKILYLELLGMSKTAPLSAVVLTNGYSLNISRAPKPSSFFKVMGLRNESSLIRLLIAWTGLSKSKSLLKVANTNKKERPKRERRTYWVWKRSMKDPSWREASNVTMGICGSGKEMMKMKTLKNSPYINGEINNLTSKIENLEQFYFFWLFAIWIWHMGHRFVIETCHVRRACIFSVLLHIVHLYGFQWTFAGRAV